MATKGTYAGYVAPELPSGQFEAADSFAQMAQRTAQKRAEERAEQRQLKAEARQAMNNAVQAGNIDMTKINNSVHGMVSKIADNYGEKLVDMMEDLDENYSYSKQLEISRAQAEFQQKVQKLTGIGGTIEQLSEGVQNNKYDPELSARGVNKLYDFINKVPELSENIDPETLQVNGKDITQAFSEQVPMDAFVPYVDLESETDNFIGETLEFDYESVRRENGKEVTYKGYQNYEPSKAKGAFMSEWGGTDKMKKLKFRMQKQLMVMPEEERENFATKYFEQDDDGELYVTDQKAFNYIEDTEIEPRRWQLTREEEIEPDEPTSSEINRAEELESNAYKLRHLHDALTPEGSEGLKGEEANIQGKKAKINNAHKTYDPLSGEYVVKVDYTYTDNDGNQLSQTENYTTDDAGLNRLSKDMYGDDFDYALVRDRVQEQGTTISTPQQGMDFQARSKAADEVQNDITNMLATQLDVRDKDTGADGKLAAYEYLAQPFPESDGTIEPLVKFATDFMNIDKAHNPEGRNAFADKYKMNIEPAIEKGSNYSPTEVASQMSQYVAIARSMKADGASDEDIAKELHAVYNGDKEFEFDRVKRNLPQIATKEKDRKKLEEQANPLLESGFSDDQVLDILRNRKFGELQKYLKKEFPNDEYDTASDVHARMTQIAEMNNMDVKTLYDSYFEYKKGKGKLPFE